MTGRSPGWSSPHSPWTETSRSLQLYSYFSSINPNKSPINYLWICFKFKYLLKFENHSSNLAPRRILTRRIRFCVSTPWNQIPRSLIPLNSNSEGSDALWNQIPMSLRPRGIRFREVWNPLGIGFQLTCGIRSCGVWDPVSDGLKELTSAGSLSRGLIHCWPDSAGFDTLLGLILCWVWYPRGSHTSLMVFKTKQNLNFLLLKEQSF